MSYANAHSWRSGSIVHLRDDLGNEVPFMLREFNIVSDAWACAPTKDWLSDSPVPKFVYENRDGSIGWSA
jgi:hypothetical protein